jgi:hypothetical protein
MLGKLLLAIVLAATVSTTAFAYWPHPHPHWGWGPHWGGWHGGYGGCSYVRQWTPYGWRWARECY